jgi:hypothetical protein
MKFCMEVMILKTTLFHILNPVASTISKWRTIKVLRWAQLLNRMVDLDNILYGGDDIEDDLNSLH